MLVSFPCFALGGSPGLVVAPPTVPDLFVHRGSVFRVPFNMAVSCTTSLSVKGTSIFGFGFSTLLTEQLTHHWVDLESKSKFFLRNFLESQYKPYLTTFSRQDGRLSQAPHADQSWEVVVSGFLPSPPCYSHSSSLILWLSLSARVLRVFRLAM